MEPYSLSDCGSLDDEELDEELLSATIESFQTGKLTPLLKTELKCRIQKRCFEEGKDLTLDDEPKSVQIKRPVSLLSTYSACLYFFFICLFVVGFLFFFSFSLFV